MSKSIPSFKDALPVSPTNNVTKKLRSRSINMSKKIISVDESSIESGDVDVNSDHFATDKTEHILESKFGFLV